MLVGRGDLDVKTMADLAGKRIGIPRGAMQDIVLSRSAPPGANIMRFDDQATAVQALIAGQVDLAGTGMLQYQLINHDDPGKNYQTKLMLQPLNFGIGIRKGDVDFLQWLNTFVYQIKSQRRARGDQPEMAPSAARHAAGLLTVQRLNAAGMRMPQLGLGTGQLRGRGRAGRDRAGAVARLSPSRHGGDVHERARGRRRRRGIGRRSRRRSTSPPSCCPTITRRTMCGARWSAASPRWVWTMSISISSTGPIPPCRLPTRSGR